MLGGVSTPGWWGNGRTANLVRWIAPAQYMGNEYWKYRYRSLLVPINPPGALISPMFFRGLDPQIHPSQPIADPNLQPATPTPSRSPQDRGFQN